MSKYEKQAQANCLSRAASAILGGIKIKTNFLPENCGQLGYTAMGTPPVINVAWWEDYFFNSLTSEEAEMLRMGVGAHETLHQVFTNFAYTNNLAKRMSRAEAGIFMQFANTIEDPAIEYLAPTVMGGWLLESLKFSIRHIYSLGMNIDKSTNAFSQLINALIHFGDMGIVKGKFTFPEAYEYFKIVAPIYNEAIICPNSKKRIDYAKECMEITRPLWEEEVKKAEFMEKLMKDLEEMLKKSGLHTMSDEDVEKAASGMPSDNDDASERRDKIVKKIKKASKSKTSEKSSESEDSETGSDSGFSKDEIEDLDGPAGEGNGDNDTSDKNGEGNGNSDNEEDNSKSSKKPYSSSKNGEESSDSDNEEDNSKSSKESYSSSKNGEGRGGSDIDSASDSDSDSDEEILSELSMTAKEASKLAKEEYEVSEDTMEAIKDSIKGEEKKLTLSESEKTSDDSLPEYDIRGKAFTSASCANKKVVTKGCSKELYNEIVSAYKNEIHNLEKRLKRIFQAEREQYARTTSGSYNILRGSVGTSARIFDKRRDKGDATDIGIFLCIDLSGSMMGPKEKIARETAIIFAEALTTLKIPYYIMGFSADGEAQAVHYHFVDWKNRKEDRESLASMRAGGNNFDGYSIRYATEVLKNFNSREKLLFVISDGEPACYTYRSYKQGIVDTTEAIKESRKSVRTFGIAFGNGCDANTLQNMYGADFIHCSDISLLTNVLTKKLEKMLKKGRD